MNEQELKQKGFELFTARERAQAQIANINQELQKTYNELDKFKKEQEKDEG